jgi:hypothetical protein
MLVLLKKTPLSPYKVFKLIACLAQELFCFKVGGANWDALMYAVVAAEHWLSKVLTGASCGGENGVYFFWET